MDSVSMKPNQIFIHETRKKKKWLENLLSKYMDVKIVGLESKIFWGVCYNIEK